jgi:hypothetical protein
VIETEGPSNCIRRGSFSSSVSGVSGVSVTECCLPYLRYILLWSSISDRLYWVQCLFTESVGGLENNR